MTFSKMIPACPGGPSTRRNVTSVTEKAPAAATSESRYAAAWREVVASLRETARIDALTPAGQTVMRGAIEGLTAQADVIMALAEKLAADAGA